MRGQNQFLPLCEGVLSVQGVVAVGVVGIFIGGLVVVVATVNSGGVSGRRSLRSPYLLLSNDAHCSLGGVCRDGSATVGVASLRLKAGAIKSSRFR